LTFKNKALTRAFQIINDVLVVRSVVNHVYYDDIHQTSIDPRAKLISVAIRTMLLGVFPQVLEHNENVVGIPILPTDLLTKDNNQNSRLSTIIGKGHIDSQRYMWAFFKNLSNLELHSSFNEIHSSTIYYIIKNLGIPEAINYWENLWIDGWIQSINRYSNLWTTLKLYENCCRHTNFDMTNEEFRRSILTRSFLTEHKANIDFQQLRYEIDKLFCDANNRLTFLKIHSYDFSEWLRGLFEILPSYYQIIDLSKIVCIMDNSISSDDKDKAMKIRRYSEECKVDILEIIQSPMKLLPITFSEFDTQFEDTKDAEKYFRFYYQGRITVPKLYYEMFLYLLNVNWPNINSFMFFLKLNSIIKHSLAEGFVSAYKILGDNNLSSLESYYILKNEIQNNIQYHRLDQFGKPLVGLIIKLVPWNNMDRLENASIVLNIPKRPMLVKFDKNVLYEIQIGFTEEKVCNQEDDRPDIVTTNQDQSKDTDEWIRILSDIVIALSILYSIKNNIVRMAL
jgi:hypothetical protein